MSKSNITLKIDTRLLKKIKVLAAQQETSVSGLMTELLERTVSDEAIARQQSYERAKRRALARIHNARPLNWQKPASRDELYER